MRILYICGAGIFSGLEKMTLDLMIQARASGHQVFCLTSSWGTGEFESRLQVERLDFQRTWLGFISVTPRWQPMLWTLDQARRLPWLWRDFRRLVREWKPDIIHHTNFHHAFLLALGPTRPGVPNIFHVHNAYAPSKGVRVAFKLIDRCVDRFIAVSGFVKKRLLEFGLAGNKIGVVLNGVPLPASKSRKGALWRQKYGWTETDVLVGIAGQIASWKGHEDFIEAIALAQRKEPRVKGVIIGSGAQEYVDHLRALGRNCLSESLAFAGYFTDMGLAYSELDILVVPSRCEESFSLSAAEGMSYGLPVIGSARGAIPEVLGAEFKDWLIHAENPPSLGEKILLLAGNKVLRSQIGERLRERARRELTLERCSDQIIGEYKAAIAERGVARCA